MPSILAKAKIAAHSGGRPPAAVEIAPEGILAAAIPGPGQPPVYAFQPLPPGSLLPGIGEPNLRAPEAIAAAIRSALGDVSPRTRSVTLILPDTVVRVFVLVGFLEVLELVFVLFVLLFVVLEEVEVALGRRADGRLWWFRGS